MQGEWPVSTRGFLASTSATFLEGTAFPLGLTRAVIGQNFSSTLTRTILSLTLTRTSLSLAVERSRHKWSRRRSSLYQAIVARFPTKHHLLFVCL
jgi:VanZ family protein